MSASVSLLVLAVLVAIAGAWSGVLLTGIPELTRRIVPVSGILLIAVSLLWMTPEVAAALGWTGAIAAVAAASAALAAFDRFIYPVCPACSHTHDHDTCTTRLHGFATPLVAASLLHTMFDGWALQAGAAFTWGVMLHKLPESIALGVILRSAMRSRLQAALLAAAVQASMFIGAAIAAASSTWMNEQFMAAALGAGAGAFLYLGFHAVHGEWRRRSQITAAVRAK